MPRCTSLDVPDSRTAIAGCGRLDPQFVCPPLNHAKTIEESRVQRERPFHACRLQENHGGGCWPECMREDPDKRRATAAAAAAKKAAELRKQADEMQFNLYAPVTE